MESKVKTRLLVLAGLLSPGANLAWQCRQVSSRSIQAWNRPSLTRRPVSNRPGTPPGGVATVAELSVP